jgi:probable rRNA maturation factor
LTITLNNRQRRVKFDVTWLAAFAEIALGKCLDHPARNAAVLAGLSHIDVVIVSDKVIADIHRRFMNVEGPTDVITFDHGEIVISAPMAKTNATRFGKPLVDEIGLYIIHGLLHLNGYDDTTPAEARLMHRTQDRILADCLKSAGFRKIH